MPFTENFLNPDGTFWSPKVSDLYSPEALGYTYGLAPAVIASSKGIIKLQNQVSTLFSAQISTESLDKPLHSSRIENAQTASANAALSLQLNIPQKPLGSLLKRKSLGSGAETMNFAFTMQQAALETQALVVLRDVEITDPSVTEFRVFIGPDKPTDKTPVSAPGFVGSFAVLDHSGAGEAHHKAAPSFLLDLSGAIQKVYGSGIVPLDTITLQLLPVSNTGIGEKIGTATPKSVEVLMTSPG
jgi:tyrosinase